jgi:large repetitive protein
MKTGRSIRALLIFSMFLFSMAALAQVFQLSGQIKTVAGNGTQGFSGDGSSATAAQIGFFVSGTALDSSQNLYIADSGNNRIRKVSTSGNISTVAGTGTAGYTGDGGAATSATISSPVGIVFDSTGNMYFSESTNQVIRKVDTSGNISTYKTLGFTPGAIGIDSTDNIYIADAQNNKVWMLDTSQVLTLFAGTGTAGYTGDGGAATSATLNSPNAVAVDPAGNVYISDNQNHAIRKVTGGTITTVAGSGAAGYGGDNGPATSANLSGPTGIAVDPLGDIYIADSNNQVIRKVDSAGVIVTLAGTGSNGYTGDGGPGLVAQFYNPKFPTIDTTTLTLYVSDTSNYVVRAIGTATALNFGNQNIGTTSSALPTELFNASFQAGTVGAISATGDFAVTNTGSCSTGATFVPGAVCSVYVTFTPTLAGPRTGTLSIAGGANGTQNLPLAGVGQIVPVNTTTVLLSSMNPALTSDTLTLTATVTPASGSTIPTGTVDFMNGSTSLGSATVDAAGTATLTGVQFPTQGTYTLTADYSGDVNFNPSTSAAVSEVVNPAPVATTTALASSKNPALTTDTLTLTATVTPASGATIPTGTVTFKNGSATLGTGTLDVAGKATLAGVSFSTASTYSLTAVYAGDSSFTGSTSAAVSEVINSPQVATTTALASSKNPALTTDTLTLTATVTPASGATIPTGTVTFKNGSATLGAGTLDATGKATLAGVQFSTAGTYSLTAVYAGDPNFTGSTSSAVSEQVNAASAGADFTVTINPNTLNIPRGGSGSATVTVTPLNGFTGSVRISCSGVPSGTACRLSPSTITVVAGAATGTLTIATNTVASISAPGDGSVLASTSQSRHLPFSTMFGTGALGIVLAAGASGLRKPNSRKRKLMGLLLLGLILAGTLIMPGCMTGPTSPLGSSTITVSATSAASSSTSHSAPLNVTIHN